MNDVDDNSAISLVAAPDRTWHALVREADRWWPEEMLTLGSTARVALEPQIGGRLYEYRSDGAGVLLGTVVEIIPDRSLAVRSTIPAAAGTVSVTTLALAPTALAGTAITLTVVGGEGEKWWRKLIETGLKPYVETPPRA